ncbi:hypothetical protein GCM10011404_01190 [Sphingomonas prati]|nr:hypothetical protein GCM10011404_01190 [Sphingomonas prati]
MQIRQMGGDQAEPVDPVEQHRLCVAIQRARRIGRDGIQIVVEVNVNEHCAIPGKSAAAECREVECKFRLMDPIPSRNGSTG